MHQRVLKRIFSRLLRTGISPTVVFDWFDLRFLPTCVSVSLNCLAPLACQCLPCVEVFVLPALGVLSWPKRLTLILRLKDGSGLWRGTSKCIFEVSDIWNRCFSLFCVTNACGCTSLSLLYKRPELASLAQDDRIKLTASPWNDYSRTWRTSWDQLERSHLLMPTSKESEKGKLWSYSFCMWCVCASKLCVCCM